MHILYALFFTPVGVSIWTLIVFLIAYIVGYYEGTLSEAPAKRQGAERKRPILYNRAADSARHSSEASNVGNSPPDA